VLLVVVCQHVLLVTMLMNQVKHLIIQNVHRKYFIISAAVKMPVHWFDKRL